MIVRTGITSFCSRNRLPEFPFVEFRRIAYACAIPCGYNVTKLYERGMTPNFHTAVLEGDRERVHLLGHSTFPIVAFAEPREESRCELSFRDLPAISESLKRMFPDVTVATLEELSRSITKLDLEKLDQAEIEQAKYWKPATVGDLAFNWWD